MFQAPKNPKSEFSQLPSFGQIAHNPLQGGNPLTSTNPSSTSSFRNPTVFSTSSFPSKTGSVLFSDQTKSPTSVAPSLSSNPFASVTNTNPLAGIFGTGPTHSPSFSPSQTPSPAFSSSATPGSSTTPFASSGAFSSSSRSDSPGSVPSNFGVGGATSSSGTVPVFGQKSTIAPLVKSNPFVPASTGLFPTPSAGASIQSQASFTTNRFDSSSKALVFSSQLPPPKSVVPPIPAWGSTPSEPLKSNPFAGSSSSNVGASSTGPKSFGGTVPSTNLFQAAAAANPNSNPNPNPFQPNTGSSVSGTYKVFSSTADSSLQAPVTSSAFSQSPSIAKTVSKVFGSSSEVPFTGSNPAKDTKTDNVGLFGKPIESKSNLTQVSSSSSSEVPKVSSTSSGLFGKSEKTIESESSGISASQPAKVGLFGKPLAPSELEPEDRATRKRSVSPKRAWSSRYEMESREGSSSSTRGAKPVPFGRLYSQMDKEPLQPASSRLFKKDDDHVADDSGYSRRRPPWNESNPVTDKSLDQSRPSRRPPFPRQMSEDDESKLALICKNIPSNFNRGAILHKHFSRFGKIARVIPNPPKRSANVHFKDHESASHAKYEGCVIAPGVRIQIFWHAGSGTRRTSTSYKDLDVTPPECDVESVQPKPVAAAAPKKRSWMNDEVEEELQMMAGTDDIQEELVHNLDRPDDMAFMPPPPPVTKAPAMSRSSRSFGLRPKTLSGASQSSSSVAEKKIPFSISEVKKVGQMAPPKSVPSLPLRKTDTTSASMLNDLETSLAAARTKLLHLYDLALRKQMKKKSLAAATALIGTCPDMCPEKERYDREAKRRLHVFEILAGTENLAYPKADHARVVKEYSRSSADQEEPLCHELRPATVLLRTMTYLLTEIANKGQDGNWTEWYDFLWDRTRGIRKDITQQMMCNVESVVMMEKCVRFHILSAERLCEEDMATFSHKINDENLTKCLQSLKYLYADMERKHKIYFETEAEFRAYVVLMNLNEGDMLREVQTLRPDILGSPEIHFAIQVYSAINSNNYSKFFKLIRKATFLNACILHRYFAQVRSKALMILMRALSSSSRPVPFPLQKLVDTLGFETPEQAATFCGHYGFIIEDGDVLLDRTSFVEPEKAPEPQRSILLVESKSKFAIGEIINGAPLPPYELLTPNSSFDKDGNLKPEMMAGNVPEKKVQSEAVAPAEIPLQPSAVTLRPFSPPQPQPESKPEPLFQREPSPFQREQSPFQREASPFQPEPSPFVREPSPFKEPPSQEQQQPSPKPFQQEEVPEQPKMVEERPQPADSAAPVPTPPEVAAIPEVRVVSLAPQTSTTYASHMKQLTLDIIKELARDMFLEIIGEFATSIAEESLQGVQTLKSIAAEIFQQTQHTTVDGLLRELSQQVCEEISLEQHRTMEKIAQDEKLLEEKKQAAIASLQKRKEREALEATRLAEEQQKLAEEKEREESEKRVTEELVEEILDSHLEDEMKQVSNEEIDQIEEELKQKAIEEFSLEAKTDILDEVIDEMCSSVSQQIYTSDVELRLKELQEREHCIGLYRMSKVLRQWKKATIVQQQQRYSLQTFPACPSWNPTADQLKKLCGPEHGGIVDETLQLNKRARMSIESPIAISRREAYLPAALTLARLRRHLTQQKAWYPLDIKAAVGKELLASSNWEVPDLFNSSKDKNEDRLYWKLLISFPELDEEADDIYTLSSLELCDWIKSKLTKGARPEEPTMDDKVSILSLYKTQLNEQAHSLSARKMLNFCARSVSGALEAEDIEQIETDKLFLGSSGLLYILPVMQISEDEEDMESEEIYWLEEQTRLATLLQAKPIKPSLPLAVVMPRHKKLSQLSLKEFIKKMNLQTFIDQELLSSVSLFTLPFCLKTPGIDVEHFIAEDKLTGSLKWLASRIPRQLLLEKKLFKDYVEDFLSAEFYGPVLYNQKIRQEEGYLQQSPHVVIDLYNSVIDHLTACATDKELVKYSWPVTEFLTSTDCYDLPSAYWNSEEHLIGIGNQLLALKLPEFPPVDEWSEKWSEAIEDVWSYIKIIIGDGPQKQAVELVSKVRNLLVRTETRFSEACLLEYGQEGCLPTAENLAWLEIIMYCINHLLISTPCLDDASSLDDQECPQEIEVVYRKSALTAYKPDVAWKDAASERNMREGPTLKSTYILSVNQKIEATKEPPSEPSRTALISFCLDTDSMSKNSKSMNVLKTSLNVEKRQSHHFEDYLERSLHEGFFEEETSFWNLHTGEWDASAVQDGPADQSDNGDHSPSDEQTAVDKSEMECEDEFLSDFAGVQSLEDKINMLKNELESCRKANTFMECCLNSLIVDPFLDEMDTDVQYADQELHEENEEETNAEMVPLE